MADVFEQIPLAGNIEAQNVFRLGFSQDCSDLPQITAWDDYNMNSVLIEALTGTAENGNKSSVCIADTTPDLVADGWATGLAQTPGSAAVNRCKGAVSYVILGSLPPQAGQYRYFQMAFGVAADFGSGTTGHTPVLGFKVFYTGTAPTVSLHYNAAASEGSPDWTALNLQSKGTGTPPSLPNSVYPTGEDSATDALDPVNKPESGEDFAPEYWTKVSE
jgi:hypothetical protein